jgi:protease-4
MRRLSAKILLTAVLLIITACPLNASAQQAYVNPTDGVLQASPSLTEVDDATALSINPSNMGFLRAWSLTYTGAWVDAQPHLAGQGHGLFFAIPVGMFGLGASLELLLPPVAVQDWQGLDKRTRLSLGVSFNPLRSIGLGLAYRTFPGYDLGDNIHTFDFSMTIRPMNYLNFVFSFQDINKPQVTYSSIEEDGLTLPGRTVHTPRRFTAALSIRPFGTDRFSIGGEFQYLYGPTKVFDVMNWSYDNSDIHSTDVRGILSWMITDGVTLKTRFVAQGLGSSITNAYSLDAALSVDSSRFPIGIIASPYFKVSPKEDSGFLGMNWTLRISGDQPAAIPMLMSPYYVVPLEIDRQMDSYSFVKLMEKIERIEFDKSVDMLLLKPQPGVLNLAQAFEIASRVKDLKNAGIPTTCYFNEADAAAYLACAAADNIWVNPAGGIRVSGLSATAMYFKSLLEKIGVKADIIRIGEYKSAPEMVTRSNPSTEAAFAMNRYLDSTYEKMIGAITAGRGFDSQAATRKIIESGPFMAGAALSSGLVDKTVPQDLMQKELENFAGSIVYIDKKYASRPLRIRTYLDAPRIAVLHIEGDIIDGVSVDIPAFGIHRTGAKTVTEQIRKLKEDRSVRAVVLRIESPGGSALASDIIWREIMALRKVKPVIASLGAVAASGGYYIASAADIIFADPNTLTGSIGIYYGKADVSALLDKIGISTTVFKRGIHADIQSWVRPYSDQEREKLGRQLKEYYNLFLDRVVEGREHGFTRSRVDKRARGRIWSGADAKHHLLVDRIGGYQRALNYARGLGFVSKGTTVIQLPKPVKSIFDRIAKRMGRSGSSSVDLLMMARETRETLKAALPFTLSNHSSPMARLPFAIIENP